MTEFLLFRLYGPLASWGGIAVGEYRPTDAHPSKSAVLGLLAAAAGVDRADDEVHRQMERSYALPCGWTRRANCCGTITPPRCLRRLR
ncbi:MAG: CRISPR-associated protein Cas5 [Proteobacteria bacterium]|nr:CRISPR-associated protein Cas5 [Pseudomonadota bacterium]